MTAIDKKADSYGALDGVDGAEGPAPPRTKTRRVVGRLCGNASRPGFKAAPF